MTNTHPLLGLLGGTFDPIHNGHIGIAKAVMALLELPTVHFIPSYQPVHRATPSATPEQRLAMVRLALQSHPEFRIDEIEMQRKGPSYSFDTLNTLHQDAPETAHCFMMAADEFLQFDQWHRWQEIVELTHIIVTTRSGFKLTLNKTLENFLINHLVSEKDLLRTKTSGYIFLATIDPIPISATRIRHDLEQGIYSTSELPAPVIEYIQKNQLYQGRLG